MIVERTHYYAKPGQAGEVLATRRRACDVRLLIGLPAGSIRIKADPTADGPDVIWECAFADEAAHKADLDARAASPDFAAVRATMGTLIERFERLSETRAAGSDGWSGDIPATAVRAAPEVQAFASNGRELRGYLWTPPGAGPHPCVIYSHGSGLKEPYEDNALPTVPLLLATWGIACFFPHRHGYGLSPGPHWRDECPGEPFTDAYNTAIVARLEREAEDVKAAFAHVAALPAIDGERIGLMGSSFGGINTLVAAEIEPRARCAVGFAMAAMNWDRNPLIAERLIAAVTATSVPLFLAQAENDFSIRPVRELSGALSADGREHVARLYPPFGATAMEGHFLAGRGPAIWGADVRHFLERWLA